MAYWGEALSYTQPLWYNENLARARAVLRRLAPTAAARAAKAPTAARRAISTQSSGCSAPATASTRLRAFADRLALLSAQFPDDDEARLFHALTLLGTIPEGARNPEISLKAGALAAAVLKRNPKHPGAAHYVLHAYDDGEHDAMALDAARIYASSRACIRVTHCTCRRTRSCRSGMWDEAAASDEASFAASVAWVKRTGRTVEPAGLPQSAPGSTTSTCNKGGSRRRARHWRRSAGARRDVRRPRCAVGWRALACRRPPRAERNRSRLRRGRRSETNWRACGRAL